jgi:class 3 adenylate cyclase
MGDIKIAWIDKSHPVIAVPWLIAPHTPEEPSQASLVDFYALFDLKTFLNIDTSKKQLVSLQVDINPLYPFLQWMQMHEFSLLLDAFMERIAKAQKYLQTNPHLINQLEKGSLPHSVAVSESTNQQGINRRLERLLDHYAQIGMVWGFSMLLQSGSFGADPFNPKAPLGIMKVNRGEMQGGVLLKQAVFSSSPSIESLATVTSEQGFLNRLKVILFKDNDRFCVGNTLRLSYGQDQSDLTIGVDGDIVCKDIALATSKNVLFIANHQGIRAFNAEGKKIDPIHLSEDEITFLLEKQYGLITYQDVSYFFLQITPFKGEDFHFFVLSPEKEVFFLVDKLNSALAWLMKHIGIQMGITAIGMFLLLLFLLDRIARKISYPIRQLALATAPIKEGHFESVPLDQVDFDYPDEVQTLYEAFGDMVLGLKEKEKVRAILNKVVSTDIATEILKNEIFLGGEEKEITIFFADIRNFTALTEEMKPSDIVQILNTCMTKISKVIDEYHGVIDKYIGDGVMALFGVPLPRPNTRLDAVLCAVEIMRVLALWNQEREQSHQNRIEMGIGIHYGKALIGNMGAENRLNYTALGGSVNLASRICSKAKPNEILISTQVYEESSVRDKVEVCLIEPLDLKGFSHKIEALRVLRCKKNQ